MTEWWTPYLLVCLSGLPTLHSIADTSSLPFTFACGMPVPPNTRASDPRTQSMCTTVVCPISSPEVHRTSTYLFKERKIQNKVNNNMQTLYTARDPRNEIWNKISNFKKNMSSKLIIIYTKLCVKVFIKL